jgi:phage portal protein BeeE
VGLLERIAEKRFGVDDYITDYLSPSAFSYGNTEYPLHGLTQTLAGTRIRQVATSLPGYAAALRACPPAFAAQMVRALVLSQARFTWRNRPWSNTPRRMFGTPDLALLERPWPKATTGDLLSLMEWHAGLTGNAYVIRQPDRLRVLRPDWCGLVWGSQQEPEDAATALDGELIGIVYQNGGLWSSGSTPQPILPDEFAHWAPIPDPECPGMGQSWVTAALSDIQADRAATEHKFKFFTNGATPNMVVKGIPAAGKEQFDEIVDMLEERHTGVGNAYRTLYLTAGADASVVGSDLKQLDFKATQGAGETRIAMLGRVPAPLLGISEGLAGSSLNAGNFGMARRIFADSWIYPSLQNLSSSLEALLTVPSNPRSGIADAELWFDTADMPLLREDARDAADIEQVKATTITTYVKEGFTPESSIAAVNGQDVTLLKHTGLTSVQLQPAMKTPAALAPAAGNDAAPVRALERGSDLQYGNGSALWHYWTKGEGLARWVGAAHKWSTLRRLLLDEGVPEHEVDGLTTNIIEAVLPGYMKLAHKKKS